MPTIARNAFENQNGRRSVAATAPRSGMALPISANQSSMKREQRKMECASPLPRIFSSIRRFRRKVVTLRSSAVSGTDVKTIRRTPCDRQAATRFS